MAKNAMILYFRMLLIMAVSLYTTRIVLQTLGIDDFGIYSVVAGFVTILGFLNGAMSSATQRFLAFELGKPGKKNIKGIFSMSMNIHILIALVVLILGETIGLWFFQNKMTIPIDRVNAAIWVFHLSLLSSIVTIISVPYNALIIAHEKMEVFGWISIIDVFLKLIIVFILVFLGVDKLILYSVLSLFVVFIIFIIYNRYCRLTFPESIFRFYWDPQIFKKMFSYTSWNLWGNIAAVMSTQGVNVLLNIFFGPSINAARAISMQVSGALNSFVQNLQVAVNPQIIKSYAAQELQYMYNLVCYGAKYNFFILLFLSAPVLINTEIILNIWLGTVPKETYILLKLIIINILVDSISAPLITLAQATGRIKLYQSVVGGILLLNVPFSYILLKMGWEAESVIYVGIGTSIFALVARLIILKKLVDLPILIYLIQVLFRSFIVVFFVVISYYLFANYFFNISGFWLETIVVSICVLCSTLVFGLGNKEHRFILNKLSWL